VASWLWKEGSVPVRNLVPLLVALTLTAGCGSGDKAEAKQAALGPSKPKPGALAAAVEDADVDAATEAKPAAAKPSTAAPATPVATNVPATTDSNAPVVNGEQAENQSLGRESFSYSGGSRDPFVSLLSTAKVGPELPDLLLVAIYHDTRNPIASVVVMREKVGGRKYSLKPGDRLGRMRVKEVRPKDVVFTIDDFGTERQEIVSLRKEDKQ
jgi:hypothetical protein